MKSNNVIEINGQLYDAKTGKQLLVSTSGNTFKHSTSATSNAAKTVDGFTRPSNKAMPQPAAPSTTKARVTQPSLPHTTEKKRFATAPQARLKARHSTTLNRSAVSAPNLKAKEAVPVKIAARPMSGALKHTDPDRQQRAATTTKSPAVQKFGKPRHTKDNARLNSANPIEKPELTKHLEKTHAHSSGNNYHRANAHTQLDSAKETLIKKAVANATTAPPHIKKGGANRRHRLIRYAPATLAFFLIAGYLVYLNIPSISLKVAANRAGFAATMPSYKPAGYSLRGPIAYSPGQVSISFASNTDDRNFSLKQQPTTWDSTALLENLVVKKSPNYLTYQDSGLTIYIFDGSNAVWVNAGKLYQVEGKNSRLDTDQLLKLATSV